MRRVVRALPELYAPDYHLLHTPETILRNTQAARLAKTPLVTVLSSQPAACTLHQSRTAPYYQTRLSMSKEILMSFAFSFPSHHLGHEAICDSSSFYPVPRRLQDFFENSPRFFAMEGCEGLCPAVVSLPQGRRWDSALKKIVRPCAEIGCRLSPPSVILKARRLQSALCVSHSPKSPILTIQSKKLR